MNIKKLLLLSLLLLCGNLFSFQTIASDQKAKVSEIGILVTQLGDFNSVSGTFSASLWLWAESKQEKDNALSSIEFPSAIKIEVPYTYTNQSPAGITVCKQIKGTFRHNWDKINFPFDKQTLIIAIEEGNSNVLSYEVKNKNTALDEDLDLVGWKLENLEFIPMTKAYKVDFGELTASKYSKLLIKITLERTSLMGFWKLTIAALIASAIGFVTYFLSNSSLIGSRMGLLVGAVFATVISMKTASGDLGASGDLTLIDLIHILVLIYLLTATIITVYSIDHYAQPEDKIKRCKMNLYAAIITTSVFVCSVITLIIMATH